MNDQTEKNTETPTGAASELSAGLATTMDYDPNLLNCGRTAKQVVKLTFADWKYRAEMAVTMGGNCRGLDIIRYAVEKAFEELLGDDAWATLVMTDAEGNTLTDDEGEDEEWLMSKLIKAEIVSITPDMSANAMCTPPDQAK